MFQFIIYSDPYLFFTITFSFATEMITQKYEIVSSFIYWMNYWTSLYVLHYFVMKIALKVIRVCVRV